MSSVQSAICICEGSPGRGREGRVLEFVPSDCGGCFESFAPSVISRRYASIAGARRRRSGTLVLSSFLGEVTLPEAFCLENTAVDGRVRRALSATSLDGGMLSLVPSVYPLFVPLGRPGISRFGGGAAEPPPECSLFENLTDYLSFLSVGGLAGSRADAVVLNDASCVIPFIAACDVYSRLRCYFSTGDFGRSLYKTLRSRYGRRAADRSALYSSQYSLSNLFAGICAREGL